MLWTLDYSAVRSAAAGVDLARHNEPASHHGEAGSLLRYCGQPLTVVSLPAGLTGLNDTSAAPWQDAAGSVSAAPRGYLFASVTVEIASDSFLWVRAVPDSALSRRELEFVTGIHVLPFTSQRSSSTSMTSERTSALQMLSLQTSFSPEPGMEAAGSAPQRQQIGSIVTGVLIVLSLSSLSAAQLSARSA